jgi:hypothetical protein
VFENNGSSKLVVTIQPGLNDDFDALGQADAKFSKAETFMLEKLDSVRNKIINEIPSKYLFEDLVVKLDRK